MNEQFKDRTYSQQLFYFSLIWTGCFVVANVIAALVLVSVYGVAGFKAISGSGDLASISVQLIKWLQIILSIVIFGLPPLIFALLKNQRFGRFFSLNKFPDLRLLFLIIPIVLFSGPVIFWILKINQGMSLPDIFGSLEQYLRDAEDKNEDFLKLILEMNSISSLVLNMFMIAVVPAFVEELFFRGTMQKMLQTMLKNPHVAIFLTGFFFSFIHFQFFGFLPRMFLGVLFGYLFYWSGNLWLPIIAHLLHNGSQVLMVYLFRTEYIETDIEQFESFSPMITMLSTLGFLAILYVFDKVAKAITEKK